MSKIPKAPSMPKPKSISKTGDVSTQAHAALLALTWEKLDALIAKLYSVPGPKHADLKEQAVKKYQEKMIKAADKLYKKAAGYKDERHELLNKLAERAKRLSKVPPPKIDADLFRAKITGRTLEKEVILQTSSISTKKQVVGFVDISCQISVPVEVYLTSQLPYFDFYEDLSIGDKPTTTQNQIPLAKIKNTEIPNPQWEHRHETYHLWFDIRTSEVPVGQLIREIKTLREYGHGAETFVVMDQDVDQTVWSMLKHEGIYVVTRSGLEALA